MVSAVSAAYAENGRAPPVVGRAVVVTWVSPRWSLKGLVQLAVADGLPVGESGVERVPVRDLGFPQLPAQEHQPVAVQRVEIEQPLVQVLDQAPAAMDRAHPV